MSYTKDFTLDRFSGVLHAQLLSNVVSPSTFQVDNCSALGAQLANMGAGFQVSVTIENEQILCSVLTFSGATATFTISARGNNSTTAATHAGGVAVEIHWTKQQSDNLQAQMAQTANVDVPALQSDMTNALLYIATVPTIGSSSSWTQSGDQTAIYTVGRSFVIVVSGVKYRGIVQAVSFGGGTTTITVAGDSLPNSGTITTIGAELANGVGIAENLQLIKYMAADPTTNAPSGYYWIYFKSGGLYTMDSSGNVANVITSTSYFGNGSDGALTITSGTTTLNTAGKNIYNYSSISVTGSATLAFGSNLQNLPIFILCQGNLVATSSNGITAKGLGGQLGANGPIAGGSNGTSGSTSNANNFGAGSGAIVSSHNGNGGGGGGGFGNAGTNGANASGGTTAGAGGASISLYNANFPIAREISLSFIGGGGGGGAAGNNSSSNDGAGGAGGNGGAGQSEVRKINLASVPI